MTDEVKTGQKSPLCAGNLLGISGSLDSVTAQYVDARIERKMEVLTVYHNVVLPEVLQMLNERGGHTNDSRDERGERSHDD